MHCVTSFTSFGVKEDSQNVACHFDCPQIMMSCGWGENDNVGLTRLKCNAAKCNVCRTAVASKEGNTSNIMTHLQTTPHKSKQCSVFVCISKAANISNIISAGQKKQCSENVNVSISSRQDSTHHNKNKPSVVNWRYTELGSISNLNASRWRIHYLPFNINMQQDSLLCLIPPRGLYSQCCRYPK